MAVRNGEPHLSAAIESVLAQSVTDFEFLIVDDASTDRTAEMLSAFQRRDPRIVVLRNDERLGPYPSVNRALRAARGDVIARHDGDDISPPERFAIQIDALQSARDVVLVTGAVDNFGECADRRSTAISRPPAWQPQLEWELLFSNAVGAGAHVMFPRTFRGVPIRFPERHPYAEDYGLWCTLSRMGAVVCPDPVVYRYRRHRQSISVERRAEQHACMMAMRKQYQSLYLQSAPAEETMRELSRFWDGDGSRPLATDARQLLTALAALRVGFLAYVEQRYGPRDAAALAAELDGATSSRVAYWLYRSMLFGERTACLRLASLAIARRQSLSVAADVAGRVVDAAYRRWFRPEQSNVPDRN